jgi:hypothetical protein
MMLGKGALFRGVWLAFLLSAPVSADELSGIRILALSPADARVVLKDEAGQVRILVPGDTLLGNDFTVRQVLADRLVLEEASADGSREMIWLFKPRSAVAISRVQRFAGKPDDDREVLDVIESSAELGRSGSAGKAD